MNYRAVGRWIGHRFEIKYQLARTAHSIVDLAFDHECGKPVVIKWLAPTARSLSPRAAARMFFHEITMTRAISALSSSNGKHLRFPQFITMGRIKDIPAKYYFVMSHIAGETLAQILAAGRPHDAVRIAQSLCQSVYILHANGIIHGDLHPQNIIVHPRGDVSLIDFGLSRYRYQTIAYLAGIGRPGYTPPEQLAGYPIDERSDLFALGQILHDLLDMNNLPSTTRHLITQMCQPILAQRRVNLTALQAELADLSFISGHQALPKRYLNVLAVTSAIIIALFYLAFLWRS